jgi:hypothetical protein
MTTSANHRQAPLNLIRQGLLFMVLLTVMIWGWSSLSLFAQEESFRVIDQEESFRVIDQVDLPVELGGGGPAGLYLELRENWTIFPEKPAIRKETVSFVVMDSTGSPDTGGERKQRLSEKLGHLPLSRGKVHLGGIEYEFYLLDPHLVGSGPEGFQEPDSMDSLTRELQAALIALVKGRSGNTDRYDLEEQLLSVRFFEEWIIDPVTLEINRQVDAIAPVIWQRRRTVEGEPVNEAGTGWPVYYKNSMATFYLRNL